jgi:hypothetical protein
MTDTQRPEDVLRSANIAHPDADPEEVRRFAVALDALVADRDDWRKRHAEMVEFATAERVSLTTRLEQAERECGDLARQRNEVAEAFTRYRNTKDKTP